MDTARADWLPPLDTALRAPPSLGPGEHPVAGVPEGHDARLLAAWCAASGRTLLHIGRNRRRMARLRAALAFFAPDRDVLALPEWDCMPYDRLSPSARVVADRMEDLARLAVEGEAQPARIVLTTVAGFLQRLPPREAVAAGVAVLEPGRPVDPAELRKLLIRAGYVAAREVRDRGEFLAEAGRVELFPPDEDGPLRLAVSGGALDRIVSETGVARDRLVVRPTAEVWLDPEAIERFRRAYVDHFGMDAESDALVQAVAAGRRHAGMEHWLPLFHARTETLLDYLPGAAVVLDDGVEARRDARLAEVADAHAGRAAMSRLERTQIYRPLEPGRLFLGADDWRMALAGRAVLRFASHGIDGGGRIMVRPAGEPGEPAAWLDDLRRAGLRVVVCSAAPGESAAVARRLRRAGVQPVVLARHWPAAQSLPSEAVAVAGLDLPEPVITADVVLIPAAALAAERRPEQRGRTPFDLGGLVIGGAVVHEEHGIGLCDGVEVVETDGLPHECVRLLYRNGAKLLVPVEALDQLWRFGEGATPPPLDALGGDAWCERRDRAFRTVARVARHLVTLAAERSARRVTPLRPGPGYAGMADRFPHDLTEGQRRAIAEVLGDLASGRLMDRLVCGDVGFGKTEVALHAAFVAAAAGRQVAVVVPTTPLARQHHDTVRKRFAGFGFAVAQLSRSVPPGRARQIKEGLRSGAVRLVVGTHALLAPDVGFADLGLLVIDEEQRLGVRQKERLKALAEAVHVLTLTATPIPRTLQMALCGLRELSVIDTPPVARRPVRSLVLPDDPALLRDALVREAERGGQSFYVCPRLSELEGRRRLLRDIAPELDVAVAHGKLAPAELDTVMSAFADGASDVLLCTNIVEAGLDIPNANTLVVHRAEMFGLAQLHQLRGRVGRAERRGYAYLVYDPARPPGAEARRRLEVLTTVTDPGAGFALAGRDLDIRGSGDLLGEEQSGHIREVGAELFHHMLREAVAAARRDDGDGSDPVWSPRLQLGVPMVIPADYIADPAQRLAVYRRAARLREEGEADDVAAELAARFGPLPAEAEAVLDVGEIKRLCRVVNVAQLDAGPKGAVLRWRDGCGGGARRRGGLTVREDGRWMHQAAWPTAEDRLAGVRRLLERLAQ